MVPVVLAVLALSVYRVFNPYTGLGVLDAPHVQLTLSLAATLYFWAECARLLSAQAGALTPVARLRQMSLSASIVLSALIIYAGPTLKAFTVGEHYVATGGWGAAVYWTAFLILGIVIAVGFCALWARMARSLPDAAPWRRSSPSSPGAAKERSVNDGPYRHTAGRGRLRIRVESVRGEYFRYDKAPVQWTGAICRDDRI